MFKRSKNTAGVRRRSKNLATPFVTSKRVNGKQRLHFKVVENVSLQRANFSPFAGISCGARQMALEKRPFIVWQRWHNNMTPPAPMWPQPAKQTPFKQRQPQLYTHGQLKAQLGALSSDRRKTCFRCQRWLETRPPSWTLARHTHMPGLWLVHWWPQSIDEEALAVNNQWDFNQTFNHLIHLNTCIPKICPHMLKMEFSWCTFSRTQRFGLGCLKLTCLFFTILFLNVSLTCEK